MQTKKRGPPAIVRRNHLATTCVALPFFFFCLQSLGFGELPRSVTHATPQAPAPDTSPRAPAGRLSPGHITRPPDSQRQSLGWIWGRCHPASPVLLAYLLHGCARLCCACWQAREWKNKRWRRGSAVRARPCKHGVPLPSPAPEGWMSLRDSPCPGTGAWHDASS